MAVQYLATPFDSIAQFEKGQAAEEAFGAGVWHSNKKVVGVWTKAETRNAWVNLSDWAGRNYLQRIRFFDRGL